MITINWLIVAISFVSYTFGYVWGYIRGRSAMGKSGSESK